MAAKTAQAQAKTAMETAAEAMKAAGLEVKVSHDADGRVTYRVGDVTPSPIRPREAPPRSAWHSRLLRRGARASAA